jgi:hypothetical protein
MHAFLHEKEISKPRLLSSGFGGKVVVSSWVSTFLSALDFSKKLLGSL